MIEIWILRLLWAAAWDDAEEISDDARLVRKRGLYAIGTYLNSCWRGVPS